MANVNACESEHWETTDSEDDISDGNLHMEGESESRFEIDDTEVGSYLNNEKEMNYKKMIWELMNQKYIQEQEAKKRVGSSKVTISKRNTGHKRETVLKKAPSIAKTARAISPEKRPNSRINYDALSNDLDGSELPTNEPKKRRSEPNSNKNVGKSWAGKQMTIEEGESTDKFEDDENGWKDDQNNEEEYDYYDDDDEFF